MPLVIIILPVRYLRLIVLVLRSTIKTYLVLGLNQILFVHFLHVWIFIFTLLLKPGLKLITMTVSISIQIYFLSLFIVVSYILPNSPLELYKMHANNIFSH